MADEVGNLYGQREQRPSLTDGTTQDRRSSASLQNNSLRQQISAIRRRHKWLQRLVLVGIVIYAIGLTACLLTMKFVAAKSRVVHKLPSVAIPVAPPPVTMVTRSVSSSLHDIQADIEKWKNADERLQEARAWIQKGRLDIARNTLETTLADNPENVEILFELAQLTFAQGADKRAYDLLQHVARINPEHKLVPQMLADVYSRLGQYEAALALAQWILEGNPDSAAAHQIAGNAELKAHRLEQAVVHFHKWSELEPDNLMALKQYAELLLALKDYAKVGGIYEKILKKKPDDGDAYRQLATCYARQAQAEKTVATLTQAMSVVGASRIAIWIKEPTFDAIRKHDLFTVFEQEVAHSYASRDRAAHGGAAKIDLNNAFDVKQMQQLNDAINATRRK